jgi:NAD-dependent DNA ligase
MQQMSVESLVTRLREAAKAYYETDTPIMSDTEYDALLDQLAQQAPNHPFLNEVGSAPGGTVVKLPVPMPSLDKRKPDSLKPIDTTSGPYVCMDKLDGISALWVSGGNQANQLLLRGNGTEGQDVSHCSKGIRGLIESIGSRIMVRGELILPKASIAGTLARNWVNGVLHQKEPSKDDLQKIQFIAYQVCEPRTLTRSQQMSWLANRGFQVAWHMNLPRLSPEALQTFFKTRREESEYECDGIVVGQDRVPAQTSSNPKDAYAFKMPLDDQRAQTIVQAVEWQSSRTGNWIPRLRFTPVTIGTATIEFCTGFHAQYIEQNKLGPGATIVIRRSGDVIPVCEKVLLPAEDWFPPPSGQWEWDSNHVHARDTSTESSPEKLALEMAHQLVALGIEGISKVTAKKLVEGGLPTLEQLKSAQQATLQQLIGAVNGEKLSKAFQIAQTTATEAQWIRAYLGWPKGFGESRIEATLAAEPSVEKWPTLTTVPKGQSGLAFQEVCKAVPGYLVWRAKFGQPSTPIVTAPKPVVVKGHYVMSGFRDASLQAKLQAAGWNEQDRITKTTTVLLVPDSAKETQKVKAARESGVNIVTRSEANGLF